MSMCLKICILCIKVPFLFSDPVCNGGPTNVQIPVHIYTWDITEPFSATTEQWQMDEVR